ncbi:unnamed protein product [Ranitomeya imitator]|uniref:VWFA domain-containing protein n=1 Tax=Ranitomeya imitator TaxID=111125 RepID=A0ABN9MGX9_9NEOB|nr:unnamed protein product [Ranitomeya imitator]
MREGPSLTSWSCDHDVITGPVLIPTLREGPAMTSRSCDRDVITGPALIPTLGPEAAACTAHRHQDFKGHSEDVLSYYNIFSQTKSQVLHNLAKGKERQWLKHQAMGELDDTKIIDGLTGEKAIYKRRGELEPELGSPQQKPKRLRLLVDVSGSMYRFNGLDGRLERSMEATCMLMEAFENYEHKFKDKKSHLTTVDISFFR